MTTNSLQDRVSVEHAEAYPHQIANSQFSQFSMAQNNMNSANSAAHIEDDGITLGDLFAMVRKHLVGALVTCLVVVVATSLFTFLAPKKYESTAQLLAMAGQSITDTQSGNASQLSAGASYINSQIATYPQLVKTEAVLKPVITKLGLNETAGELAGQITATNPSNTMMVNITAETSDPQLSQDIANAVADSLSAQVSTNLDTIKKDKAPVTLSVVQEAQLPTSQSFPKIKLFLAAGLVLGIILGIAYAIVRELLNTKVSSSQDARNILGTSAIGVVPDDEILDTTKPAIIAEPNGMIAEEYRKIRTNLSFFNVDQEAGKGQLIVITSAMPSEGKTTTVTNTAVALAELGKKVLVVDADLRHPSVAHEIGMQGGTGLVHILSGQLTPTDVVQSYWKPNLHILPAGKRPANASILLNSTTMTMLLEQARTQYDYVIVDTAPMNVANDAVILGRLANGLVMVVGKGICEKHDLQDAADALQTAQIPVLGYVLTFADPKKLHSGNYYYYNAGSASGKSRRSVRSSRKNH